MICDKEIRVQYCETDQMGIVHHSNYFRWFEVGREELGIISGISYKKMEEEGIMMPLSSCEAKFYGGAKYEDVLIIRTKVEELSIVRLKYHYEIIRKEDEKLIAEGWTMHAFTDFNLKPLNLKKKKPHIYSQIEVAKGVDEV